MPSTHGFDRLREAVALAHTVPGVSLELRMAVGHDRILVSDRCLGAHLTPCQLRAAVLAADHDTTSACFTMLIEDVDVRGAAQHLGGGLFDCSSSEDRNERWFATPLHPDRIVALLEGCSVAGDHAGADDLGALLKHDEALGMCSVCLMSTGDTADLDAVAVGLLAAVLADEVIGDAAAADHS